MSFLKKIPGAGAVGATFKFLDRRLPKIRGKPAISEIIGNLKPGITVSLVSLPLSISLALAADATPVQGLITAIWAGGTSALFGGSHYNVVGPTGALSGVLSEFSIRYGPGIQPLLAMIAGIMSLLVWLFKLERYFAFIPSAVMHGFTLGVAFIITMNQVNFAFGLPKLPRHEKFLDNLAESLYHLGETNYMALAFFIVSFGSLFWLQKRFGKIPWSIVLAIVGIIIGVLQGSGGPIATIASRYGSLQMQLVQVAEAFTKGINADAAGWLHILGGCVSITVIAVLETLISAHIADRMTKTLFDQPREVLAVGLANLASGLAGGIPATAALARTALNVKSGATSRGAGIVNAISITLLASVLFPVFKFLPLPVVAAILVSVAYRMVEWPEVASLLRMDKGMFVVAMISMLICIAEDPTMGIIVGALAAQVRTLLAMRKGHAVLTVHKGRVCLMAETVSDVNAKKAVSRAAAKFAATVTTEAVERAAAASVPGDEAAAAAIELAASKLAGVSTPAVATSPLAGALAARRPSAVDADLLTTAPAPSKDASVPLIATYALPGYLTYVAAQGHRDRIRALFTEGVHRGADGNPTAVTSSGVAGSSGAGGRMPGVRIVAFSLADVFFADPDALETLGTLAEELGRAGYEVHLIGFRSGHVFRAVRCVHHLDPVHKHASLHAMLKFLRRQVREEDGLYVRAAPIGSGAHGDRSHGDAHKEHGHSHGDHGHSHGEPLAIADGAAASAAAGTGLSGAGASAGDVEAGPASVQATPFKSSRGGGAGSAEGEFVPLYTHGSTR